MSWDDQSEEDWDKDEVPSSKPSGSRSWSSKNQYQSQSKWQSTNDRDYKENNREFRPQHNRSDRDFRSRPDRDYQENDREFRPQHNRNDRDFRSRPDRYGGKNSDHSSRIDIQSNKIGLIIGKGGSNIRNIQDNYSVKVNINKNDLSVEVSGEDKSNVDEAINYIREQCNPKRDQQEESREYNKKQYNSSYNKNNESQNNFLDLHDSEPAPLYDDEPIDMEEANRRADEYRKEKFSKYPQIKKDFYIEHEEVAALTSEKVDKIRMINNNIKVERHISKSTDENTKFDPIPKPVWKFKHCFEKYPDLMAEIEKQGFKDPSPIQCQAWPILLKGEDMIGIAQTGTGKTLAFLLPALIHTEFQPAKRHERGGANVLVLAPTRELALQIEKEVSKYSFRGIKSVCFYGGGDRDEQIRISEEGVQIIIATPGRLNDLIFNGKVNVSSVTYLVLDEADRMLDLGFGPQINKILIDIRDDRQTVMTSATWPSGIQRIANTYMLNPIKVTVGKLELAGANTVTQKVEFIDQEDKFARVLKFIEQDMGPNDKAIIFCGRRVIAEDLSSDLALKNFMIASINGSKDQHDREQAIEDITTGYAKVLIATDIASRGLDIDDITFVVNYDFPNNIEEYVHRVGRTGRAGKSGTSITFMTRNDWRYAQELIDILEKTDQEVPYELVQMAQRFNDMKKRRENENFAAFGRRGRRGGGRRGGGFGMS